MKHLAISFAVLMLMWAGDAKAEGPTTDMLRASCNYDNLPAKHQQIAKTMCFSYMHGFLDYQKALKYKNMPKLFCLPKGGITLGTASAFFMRMAEANPDLKDVPAGLTFSRVLEQYFPCK